LSTGLSISTDSKPCDGAHDEVVLTSNL
jgi:hypothetical protein